MNDSKSKNEKVRRHHHGGSVFGAFFLISLGIIFLLNNFGILSWNVWSILWKFWPVLLINWGLEMVFGKSFFGYTLATIIGLLLLAFVLAFAFSKTNQNFRNWMMQKVPNWKQMEERVPFDQGEANGKVFKCDSSTGECEIITR